MISALKKANGIRFCAIVLFMLAGRSWSAVGESAVITLIFPPGSRATGLGEAFTGVADDVNATFFNPAGLGQAPLANSWKAHLADKGITFTAIASKRKSEFGLREKIWVGTRNGLMRFNGKTWETSDVYLIERGDDPESVAGKYLSTDDEKIIERAEWAIRAENGIGMKRYASVKSLLKAQLNDSLLAAAKQTAESVAHQISRLPKDDRVASKVYGIIALVADSLKADSLSDKITAALQITDIEFEDLVELKVPFTIAISDSVTALAVDASERLWVGTERGLWRLDETSWTVYTVLEGLPSNKIASLSVGPYGEIAAGTDQGLTILTDGQWKTYGISHGLPDSVVSSVTFGQGGAVYAGTAKGLVRMKDSAITVFDTSNGLLSQSVRALFFDSRNKLWIGGDNGVSVYDETSWKRYKFPESQVSSFAEHSSGKIWIGTNKGAISYKAGRTNIGAEGKVVESSPEWKAFHAKNALKGNDVSGMAVHGNDIWLATDQAVNQYDNAEKQVLIFYEPLLPAFGIRELWHTYGAFVLPTEDWGTLGFSINFINMGNNTWTDDLGRELGRARSWEGVFSLSYGLPIKENLSVGGNIKYVHSALAPGYGKRGEGVGRTFAIDAAILKRDLFFKDFDLGLMAQNMGPDIFYISKEEADPIPFTVRIGLAYGAVQTPIHDLKLLFDINREFVENYVDKPSDPFWKAIWTDALADTTQSFVEELQEANYNFGIEYWYANFMALRTGLLGDYVGERYELTIGLGLRYGNLNFDWSYIHAPEGFLKGILKQFDPEKTGANGARHGQWRASFLFRF